MHARTMLHAAFLTIGILLASGAAMAQERAQGSVPPDGFWEYPEPTAPGQLTLEAGDTVTYSWRAQRADGQPLEVIFNVHYNETSGDVNDIKHAAGPLRASVHEGTFTADQKDTYFFMWENQNPLIVDIFLEYTLDRVDTSSGFDLPAPGAALLVALVAVAGLLLARRSA